jgi:predicted DNA binding CopG/RHH family protein
MFKQIIDFFGSFLFLARDTRENKEAIENLRFELQELADNFEKLSFEVQRINDREKLEREKLVLQLENALLRIERRLPPGKSSKN